MRRHPFAAGAIGVVALIAFTASPAWSQEDDDLEEGLNFRIDLGGIWTGGNQETFTASGDGRVYYLWPKSRIRFRLGGLSTQSTLTTRTAVGTGQDDFQLFEEAVTETTAEAFFSRLRYDYEVSERFFVFSGGDWLRNTFQGIDSRFLVAAGAGNLWADNDQIRFSTDYSFTYTFEDEVVSNPFTKSSFPGLRLGYDFLWNVSQSTNFESQLDADFNLDNTDDVRLDWYNALPIDINSILAFKPSLRLIWRNDPALKEVPLFDAPGGEPTGTVLTPLEKTDTFFSLSLLFKF